MEFQRRRTKTAELPLGGKAEQFKKRNNTKLLVLLGMAVTAIVVVLVVLAGQGRPETDLAAHQTPHTEPDERPNTETVDPPAEPETKPQQQQQQEQPQEPEEPPQPPEEPPQPPKKEEEEEELPQPPPVEKPAPTAAEVENAGRRAAVAAAFNFTLSHYIARALGADELRPISGTAFNDLNYACTLVDAMSTALVMGMDAHYRVLRDYVVSPRFDPFNRGRVSVFETTIRVLGGLESAYALTGATDAALLAKTVDVFESLRPAFATGTGIPIPWVVIANHRTSGWGGTSNIAECGTLQLELSYLTEATGNPEYREMGQRIVRTLAEHNSRGDGLFPADVNIHTGGLYGGVHTGSGSDSFYEYLVKMYVMHRHGFDADDAAIAERYRALATRALTSLLGLERRSARGYAFLSAEHLGCFVGGMYALAAHTLPDLAPDTREAFFRAAERYTEGCYMAYATSPTGLAADVFDLGNPDGNLAATGRSNILRPEAIESIFYLWRYTHDPKYREWGWHMFQALERHQRRRYGYTGLDNAQDPNTQNDHQQSWFLGETLKYFYLLFSDDDVIPLDRYVLNTEAHPLPVCSWHSRPPSTNTTSSSTPKAAPAPDH